MPEDTRTDTLVDRVVVAHRYSWTTPGPTPGSQDYHYADRGQTIRISEAEAARGDALGGLSTADALEQAAAYRLDLERKVAELNAQAAAHLAVTPPAPVNVPAPSRSGVVLTPSQTGVPQLEPLPTDRGPIAPTTPSAVAAARAIAAERGDDMLDGSRGFAGTPTAPGTLADASTATPPSPAPSPGDANVDDDVLAGYDVPTTLAFLNQNPDQVDRLADLEHTRERGPRKGVTDAIDAIREAQATQ